MKKMLVKILSVLVLATTVLMSSCKHPAENPFIPAGVDYGEAKIGNIILSDGTICELDDFDSTTMTAVAVIIREASIDECALGIGLYEGENKSWCIKAAKGYASGPLLNLNTKDSIEAYKALLEKCDDVISPNKYPAWEYCAKYGQTNSLPAPFNIGWCLPTVHELDSLNGTVFNTVYKIMNKIKGDELKLCADRDSVYHYYVTCNSAVSYSMYVHDLDKSKVVDKVTGKVSNQTNAVKLLARPVYHFENNQYTLAAPIFTENGRKITISTRSENAVICYQKDNGDWEEGASPVEIDYSKNGDSHTITAYTKKDGLENSKQVTYQIGVGQVY